MCLLVWLERESMQGSEPVNPALQRYVDAATGLTEITTAKAEQIAKQLVKSGEAAQDQMGELVDELLERQKKNREAIASLVKTETNRAVRAMGLATTQGGRRPQARARLRQARAVTRRGPGRHGQEEGRQEGHEEGRGQEVGQEVGQEGQQEGDQEGGEEVVQLMGDPLEQLRRDLAEIDEHPVGDRVALFERANEVLAGELAALDELTGG
jgi:polyhydroxyalkanoate synthesis regulator phasin